MNPMNSQEIQKIKEIFKDPSALADALRHTSAFDQNVQWRNLAEVRLVLPRPFDAYLKFFKLTDSLLNDLKEKTNLLQKPILLDIGGGCSDFAQKMNRKGIATISADPVFFLSREGMLQGFQQLDRHTAIDKLKARDREFKDLKKTMPPENISSDFKPIFNSIEDLVTKGFHALDEFIDGFDENAETGMYLAAETPNLPFKDQVFELVLASHFVFSGFNLDLQSCLNTIKECARVGKEVRIFPTATERFLKEFLFFETMLNDLKKLGYHVERYETDYELYPEKRFGLIIHRK